LGNKRRYQRKSKPSLAIRSSGLKQAYPLSEYNLKRNKFIWRGKLQPTALSAAYDVEMSCEQNDSPDVWVSVANAKNIESIPHKYEADKDKRRVKVCLYLPEKYRWEWRFVDTIIPWTIEWLYFYEIWLATGEWCGGGYHQNGNDKTRHRERLIATS
jgi:hypothetical protein